MSNQPSQRKATITIDAANRDRQFHAYQLSINAMSSENIGHGYRLMGPKYIGRSRNLKTVQLTQRDADDIRAILHEARNHFPELEEAAEPCAAELALAGIDLFHALSEHLRARHGIRVRILPLDVMSGRLRTLSVSKTME